MIQLYVVLVICMLISACNDSSPDLEQHAAPTKDAIDEQKSDEAPVLARVEQTAQSLESAKTFFSIIQPELDRLAQETRLLERAIYQFSFSPTQASLDDAMTAWHSTHASYQIVSFLTQISLPFPYPAIEKNDRQIQHNIDVRIDQYPLLTGYLDSVPGYPNSGLINSEDPITLEFINHEHQFSDEYYVTMGFHALEFILLGEPLLKLTPEQRFHATDDRAFYQQDMTLASPQERRTAYIQLLAATLRSDIMQLIDAWRPAKHFDKLISSYPAEAQKELINQLLEAAKAQMNRDGNDDEHLSDNTKTQLQTNIGSIESVLATYTSPST